MVGLGTLLIALMLTSAFLLYKQKIEKTKWVLWTILFALPFPYIANIAGWYTTELGRQPWLVYNLLETAKGISPVVSSGNTLFTFLGFVGLYFLLGMLFLLLAGKIINKGPELIN